MRGSAGRQFGFIALALTVVALASTAPTAQAPARTVLRGATVITGTGAAPIRDAVIVIEGDRIQAVGGKTTAVPADATVVDVSGKFIIPGLVESHAHYEEWMGELFLNYGITSAYGIGGRFDELKETSYKPESRFPRIFDTNGEPSIASNLTEEQVRDGVRKWAAGKPDFCKLRDYTEESRNQWMWAADEVHKAGLLVFGHTNDAPSSIRDGHDIVEHMWGFIIPTLSPEDLKAFKSGEGRHWSLYLDWAKVEPLMKDAIGKGIYVNPTFFFELGSLSSHSAEHEKELFALYSDPNLSVYYPKNISESLLQKQHQIRNFNGKYENLVLFSRIGADERAEYQRGYTLAGEFLKRWVALGGKLQAGTDTVSGGTPGITLHHEMELFVEGGLTPMQAIQSATVWSAEMLAGKNRSKGEPKIGAIAPGMFADLVVLSADPLQSIASTRAIDRVMKGGAFVKRGYTAAYYTFTRPPRSIAMATPLPELSNITPHTVAEGGPAFEMTVRGVGFVSTSVIRINGVTVPTTFVDPRTLKATVPASVVKSASPNDFEAPGPEQFVGVFGDRTVKVTVFTAPPEGGESNSISLRVRPKWLAAKNAT